ncbi:hypothetical protein JB92DRAFT_1815264 [Gautieria morchelliformis]|nr:hypothetical protein JB92DRAFT_1815264 [Gautieria morchelliformis]
MHVPSSLSPSNIRKKFTKFTRTLSPLLPFLQVKRDRPYPASTTTTAPSDSARTPKHFAVVSRPAPEDSAPAPNHFAVVSRPAPDDSAPASNYFAVLSCPGMFLNHLIVGPV